MYIYISKIVALLGILIFGLYLRGIPIRHSIFRTQHVWFNLLGLGNISLTSDLPWLVIVIEFFCLESKHALDGIWIWIVVEMIFGTKTRYISMIWGLISYPEVLHFIKVINYDWTRHSKFFRPSTYWTQWRISILFTESQAIYMVHLVRSLPINLLLLEILVLAEQKVWSC